MGQSVLSHHFDRLALEVDQVEVDSWHSLQAHSAKRQPDLEGIASKNHHQGDQEGVAAAHSFVAFHSLAIVGCCGSIGSAVVAGRIAGAVIAAEDVEIGLVESDQN